MRRVYTIFLVIVLSDCLQLYAQMQNNNWVVGMIHMLNFSSVPPTLSTVTQTNAQEGSASISDASGNLLFYTDGQTVWRANGSVMTNGTGLMGEASSTQSALILPDPGNRSRYYVFTSDQGGYVSPNQGTHYSVVDMAMANGNGAIVSGLKNIVLDTAPMTEKLTAVRHCNGRDWWVITHRFNSSEFIVHLLNTSGVQPGVSYFVGTPHVDGANVNYAETIGEMQPSSDGAHLALAVYGESGNFVELFDFDNAWGTVSNPILLTFPALVSASFTGMYGLSYSPDNSKLYVTYCPAMAPNTSYILQFNLLTYNASAISASQYIVAQLVLNNNQSPYFGMLEAGRDGKVYVGIGNTVSIGCINSPNNAGVGCNYNGSAITGMVAWTQSKIGMQNFPDAWEYDSIKPQPDLGPDSTFCDTGITLNVTVPQGASLLWSTGDTTSEVYVTATGWYWVEVNWRCPYPLRDSIFIENHLIPQFELGEDTITCNSAVVLSVAPVPPDNSVLWNTGEIGDSISAVTTGEYWVIVTQQGCPTVSDTIMVVVDSILQTSLADDYELCTTNSLVLNATYNAESFLWSTGETGSQITVSENGDYWVTLSSSNCATTTDTIHVALDACGCIPFLPNAFTPDGNSVNNVFRVESACAIENFALMIFDRWGNLIYSSNDQYSGWDGTFKGNACQEDAYVYKLSGMLPNASGSYDHYSRIGHVVLLR